MTSKHSEGPWGYDPEHLVVRGPNDREICDIGFHMHPDRSPGEEMQRAHLLGLLIAQAPDLKKEKEALLRAASEFATLLWGRREDMMRDEASQRGLDELDILNTKFHSLFDPIIKKQGVAN